MPKVFTGKVVIPGDKIDEYFKAMAEAEKEREPFRRYLEGLTEEFSNYLAKKYARKTANKHSLILEMFVEFISRQTDVKKVEEITAGMVNTHFRQWYKRKVLDSSTPDDLRVALTKFFQFLETEKGISNSKALAAGSANPSVPWGTSAVKHRGDRDATPAVRQVSSEY